jgi:hypothetical protein
VDAVAADQRQRESNLAACGRFAARVPGGADGTKREAGEAIGPGHGIEED